MWTDGTKQVADDAPYTDAQGTQYPGNFPKGQIAGLTYVPPTPPTPAELAAQLAQAKAAKNQQINVWRSEANQSSFAYSGKQIACDQLSRSDIDAVAGSIALTGAFPAGFPNAWKAMDNTYISIPDVATFKAMYAAMTLQGTINFGHSQDLKAALAAATTVEQIDAIVW